jgi:hypothetical protein
MSIVYHNSHSYHASARDSSRLAPERSHSLTHGIGIAVVDRADENITPSYPVDWIHQRAGIVLENLVVEDNNVTGVQLMTEHWWSCYITVIRYVHRGVKVCFGTFTDPVDYVNDDKFLIVTMGFRHDISESTKEVHTERAVRLPPTRWHQLKKCVNEIPSLGIVQELDTSVLPFAGDARTVSDRDRIVSPQGETPVLPLVTNNVPGSQTIHRPVALVVPERPLVEVRLAEIRPELPGKSDRLVVGQRVTLAVQGGPDILMAVGYGLCCVIAHSGTRKYLRRMPAIRTYDNWASGD